MYDSVAILGRCVTVVLVIIEVPAAKASAGSLQLDETAKKALHPHNPMQL